MPAMDCAALYLLEIACGVLDWIVHTVHTCHLVGAGLGYGLVFWVQGYGLLSLFVVCYVNWFIC